MVQPLDLQCRTQHLKQNKKYRCEYEPLNSIPFLVISISIVDGKIDTELFKKDTDRNQYLLRESCHPQGVTAAIPFSLGLRIVRICLSPENRDRRLNELNEVLKDRGYSEQMIDRGIERARQIPRNAALLKVKTKEKKKTSCICHKI